MKGYNVILRTLALTVLVLAVAAPSWAQASKDPADGEFYTEEEYKALPGETAAAYCDALSQELTDANDRARNADSEMRRERDQISQLQSRLRGLDSELNQLESAVGTLEDKVAELEALPSSYTVERGDCLWHISGSEDIYSDPVKWTRIYRANRDMIEDPDLIYPDQVFDIPRDVPTQYMVNQDEWLSRIAGYWEIYDDWTQWTRIYEANRDQINDPDLIYPDQVFRIPR